MEKEMKSKKEKEKLWKKYNNALLWTLSPKR